MSSISFDLIHMKLSFCSYLQITMVKNIDLYFLFIDLFRAIFYRKVHHILVDL